MELLDAGTLARTRGRLIAIEGIDQSGKKTQTHLLAERLRAKGYPATIMSFPDYTTPVGRLLQSYLTRGKRLDFHAIHLLYAANKYERASNIRTKIERGHFVIINRYTPSNLAYGLAHHLPLVWLNSLEKDLPKPNLVLLLDVSPRVSFSRKERGRDVHEKNVKYLEDVRRAYIRLAKKYGWHVISGEGRPMTVSLEILHRIEMTALVNRSSISAHGSF
jgi:dTMP kinase